MLAILGSTLIAWARASGLESPMLVPSRTEPCRGAPPPRARIAFEQAGFAALKGPDERDQPRPGNPSVACFRGADHDDPPSFCRRLPSPAEVKTCLSAQVTSLTVAAQDGARRLKRRRVTRACRNLAIT